MKSYKVEKTLNGWQRVTIDFSTKVTPKWWQFWKKRIDRQDSQYSIWTKSNKEGGFYFWPLEDWAGNYLPEEITQELYEALIKFEEERK